MPRQGRYPAAIAEARRRFGTEPFTVADFVEVLRGHVNPMEAARLAERRIEATRRRKGVIAPYGHYRDVVEVGMRTLASQQLNIRATRGTLKRVGRGVYRWETP